MLLPRYSLHRSWFEIRVSLFQSDEEGEAFYATFPSTNFMGKHGAL